MQEFVVAALQGCLVNGEHGFGWGMKQNVTAWLLAQSWKRADAQEVYPGGCSSDSKTSDEIYKCKQIF